MPDRNQMLKEINEVSFVIDDLKLFLDTHPLDEAALTAFSQAMEQRKQLLKEFAKQFEPLTQDCICPDTNNQTGSFTKHPGQKHFTWSDGPLPWEGGTL
ncbi:MAG: spore coat protein CotJB [Enterocloster asparagiformis]|nr:spore coat protein CotJB [Enterocloster asparagiformis]